MGLLSGSKTRVKTSTWEENRTEELDYLTTLKITVGENNLAGLESDPTKQSSYKDNQPDPLEYLQQAMTMGFAGQGTTRSTTIDSTGWKVKNKFMVTKWDHARYAIGIKDLAAYRFKYVPKSGFISVPFRTPKPIASVSLHTDEFIPTSFNTDTVKPWICYWVSLNDGHDWTPIAPTASLPCMVDGARIPEVIHVNSGIPQTARDPREGYVDLDVQSNQIRLKAILERPLDADSITPVLKGYRLCLMLRGAL